MLFKSDKTDLTSFFQTQSLKNKNQFFYLNLLIHPSLVGNTISVYVGNQFIPLIIKEDMIGLKLKDFVFTKKKAIFKKDKKDNLKKRK